MKKHILIFLLLMFISAPSFSYDKTVHWSTWDGGNDYIDHYKVYWGTSSLDYTNESTALSKNQASYTVTELTDGVAYYFAVKAFDANGYESSFSNEVSVFAVLEPLNGFIVNENNYQSYSFSGVGLANGVVELFASDLNNPIASTVVNGNGVWSVEIDLTNLAQGPVVFKVAHSGEEKLISGLSDRIPPRPPFSVLFDE